MALVSYVLNGKEKESRVGQEIAGKIKQIAHELGYQPNHLAKSLRSGKTHTIGLIIADISNPFFANIARVVEDEAKRHGYTVIIGSSDENAEKSRSGSKDGKQVFGFKTQKMDAEVSGSAAVRQSHHSVGPLRNEKGRREALPAAKVEKKKL